MKGKSYNYIISIVLSSFFINISLSNTIDTVAGFSVFNKKVAELNLTTDFQQAEIICSELDHILKNNASYETESILLTQKLKFYTKFNKYAKGITLALLLEEKHLKNANYIHCRNKKYLFQQLSEYMIAIRDYKKAINYLNQLKSLECFEHSKYSILNYNQARLYTYLNQNDSALAIIERYVNYSLENKDSASLIGAFNQSGLIYATLNYNLEAIKSYEKAIEVIDEIGDRKGLKPVLLGNIGHNYRVLGNIEKAQKFLNLDSKGSNKYGITEAYINSEIELAEIEYDLFEFKQAISRAERLLNQYDQSISSTSKRTLYHLLSSALEKNNETNKSLFYLKKYNIIEDSLNNTQKKRYESLINEYSEIIYNKAIQEKNQRNELIKKDFALQINKKKIANQQKNFLILILLLTIFILFLVFKRIIDSKKKNALLIIKQLKINEQDLKLKSTEKKILELQIADDNKKINSLALELNLKSNFSDSLMNKLKDLDKIPFAELRNIELFVQNELDLKSNRAKLQNDIEALGNNFFKALTKKHHDLKDSDLKLCSFIVLNLSNKEIAVSKNIATNSVKISKNRLKKKLNIDSNQDLKSYLQSFL